MLLDWKHKTKKHVISLIKEEKPDVLGIQEGLPHQIKYLSNQLDEYSMIGEGRDGGDNGEYSAIYYKNKNNIELHPANSSMSPIIVDRGDFSIKGILVGLYRSY